MNSRAADVRPRVFRRAPQGETQEEAEEDPAAFSQDARPWHMDYETDDAPNETRGETTFSEIIALAAQVRVRLDKFDIDSVPENDLSVLRGVASGILYACGASLRGA